MNQDIEELFDQLFILDHTFRERMKTKLNALDASKIEQLKAVLIEILEFQKQKVAKQIMVNPATKDHLVDIIQNADRAILSAYEEILNEADKIKIQNLLSKIHSL